MFTETLTGFKHMGNESDRLIKNGETVLFAFEEAIGFMCGSAVLDKVRVFSVYVYVYRRLLLKSLKGELNRHVLRGRISGNYEKKSK